MPNFGVLTELLITFQIVLENKRKVTPHNKPKNKRLLLCRMSQWPRRKLKKDGAKIKSKRNKKRMNAWREEEMENEETEDGKGKYAER